MMNEVDINTGSLSLQMTDKQENREWGDSDSDDNKENKEAKKAEMRRKSARGHSKETQVSPEKNNAIIDQLKKENKKLQTNVQTLTKAKDNLTKERDNIKKERDNLTKEKNTLAKEKDTLQKKYDKLETDHKGTDDVQTKLGVAVNDNVKLKKDKDQLETEKNNLQTEIDKLTTDNAALNDKIKGFNDQTTVIKDLNDEIEAKDTEISILNERLTEETEAKNELAQEAMKNDCSSSKEPKGDTRQRLLLITDEKNKTIITDQIKDSKFKWETLESINTVENVKDLISDSEFIRKLSTYHGIVIMLGGYDIMIQELSPNTVNEYMKEVISVILDKTKSFIILCETPPATGKLGMFTMYNIMLRSITTEDPERITFFTTQQYYRMIPKRDSMVKDSPYLTNSGAQIWVKNIMSAINIPADFDIQCDNHADNDTVWIDPDDNMHVAF